MQSRAMPSPYVKRLLIITFCKSYCTSYFSYSLFTTLSLIKLSYTRIFSTINTARPTQVPTVTRPALSTVETVSAPLSHLHISYAGYRNNVTTLRDLSHHHHGSWKTTRYLEQTVLPQVSANRQQPSFPSRAHPPEALPQITLPFETPTLTSLSTIP